MRRVIGVLLLATAVALVVAAIAGPDSVRGGWERLQALFDDVPGEAELGEAGSGRDGIVRGEAGEALDYVALGDSIAAGFATSAGYPELVAEELEARAAVSVELDTATRVGWTTGRATSAIAERERLRDALAEADLVTVSIGSNDLFRAAFELGQECSDEACARPAVDRFLDRWDELLDELDRATEAEVVVTDLYDPFSRSDAAADTLARQLRAEANEGLAAAAQERGFAVARVSEAFHGEDERIDTRLLAFDGIHPGRAGQERIAELVIDALER